MRRWGERRRRKGRLPDGGRRCADMMMRWMTWSLCGCILAAIGNEWPSSSGLVLVLPFAGSLLREHFGDFRQAAAHVHLRHPSQRSRPLIGFDSLSSRSTTTRYLRRQSAYLAIPLPPSDVYNQAEGGTVSGELSRKSIFTQSIFWSTQILSRGLVAPISLSPWQFNWIL